MLNSQSGQDYVVDLDAIQPRCRLNTDLRSRSRGPIERRKASEFTEKLTKTRADLNAEIVKELRIKEGCENLLKVLPKKEKDRKKDVSVWLSFADAKLMNLRRELHELNEGIQSGIRQSVSAKNRREYRQVPRVAAAPASNRSSVSSRSGEPKECFAPMIAIGSKTTDDIDYKKIFSKMLRTHYKEDPAKFDAELSAIQEIRERVQTPQRSDSGLEDIFTYYHALIYAEHRFFLEEKNEDVAFRWYDVFTGKIAIQQSVALEKACVAFNAAAVATQIASEKNLSNVQEANQAKEYLEMAAGCFEFILSHFTKAPTDDMSFPCLKMLQTLVLAQAQECMWMLYLAEATKEGHSISYGEPAAVAQQYRHSVELLNAPELEGMMIPKEWGHILKVKEAYYDSLANFHWANMKLEEIQDLPEDDEDEGDKDDEEQNCKLALSRVMQSQAALVNARSLCREHLPQQVHLKNMVKSLTKKLNHLKQELGFRVKIPPRNTRQPLKPLDGNPNEWSFGECEELFQLPPDPFERLGPLYFFNSMCSITNRRTVTLVCKEGESFGIRIGGDGPLSIAHVLHDSVAYRAGVRVGNYIMSVNGEDVRNADYDQVIQLVKLAVNSNHVEMELVENIDMQNFEELAEDEDWGEDLDKESADEGKRRDLGEYDEVLGIQDGTNFGEDYDEDYDEEYDGEYDENKDYEEEYEGEEEHDATEEKREVINSMPNFHSVFAKANSGEGERQQSIKPVGFKSLFMRSLRESQRRSRESLRNIARRSSAMPGEIVRKSNPLVVGEAEENDSFNIAASIGIHPLRKRSAADDLDTAFHKRLSGGSFDA